MLESIVDLVAAVLAADAIVTAWFYGTIFKNTRVKLEKMDNLLGELAGCPLCLSYHICFWVILLLWLPLRLLDQLLDFWVYATIVYSLKVVLYSLAATDLVHWLQGERPIPLEQEEEDDPRN